MLFIGNFISFSSSFLFLISCFLLFSLLLLIVVIIIRPEPHILLFRRPLGTDPISGEINPDLEREAKLQYQMELAANQAK